MKKIFLSLFIAFGCLTSFAQTELPKGSATGTNTYSVTIANVSATLKDGIQIVVKLGNANTSTATLKLNTLAAKAIKLNGAALASGDLPANVYMLFTYNASASAWQVSKPGSGGASPPAGAWSLTGNVLGADTKWLGSSDNFNVGFKTNNTVRETILKSGEHIWGPGATLSGSEFYSFQGGDVYVDDAFLVNNALNTSSRSIFGGHWVYGDNYAAQYVARSLVDKNYVDSVKTTISSGLTVGTTAIASGTDTRLLYQKAVGVLGQNAALTFDETNLVLSPSGLTTIGSGTTTITNNLGIGTAAATSPLTIRYIGGQPALRLDGNTTSELYLDWSEAGVEQFFISRYPSAFGTALKRNQVSIVNSAGAILLNTAGYEQLFLGAAGSFAGNVAINHVSPTALLHIKCSDALHASKPAFKITTDLDILFATFFNDRKLQLNGIQDSAMLVLWSDAYTQTDAGFRPTIDFREYSSAYTPYAQIGERQHTGSGDDAFYSLILRVALSTTATPTEVLSLTGQGKILTPTIHNNSYTVSPTTSMIASGTYTATITDSANTSARTAYQSQWTRVGNVVTVSGVADVDPTTTLTATIIKISLPIASNFTAVGNCRGTANAEAIGGQSGAVLGTTAYAASDFALMKWMTTDVTNQPMSYTFTYLVQ